MHPGDHSGHVIDLGVEPLTSQLPLASIIGEKIDQPMGNTNTNRIQIKKERDHQLYQQVF